MHFQWIFIEEQGQIISDTLSNYKNNEILRIMVLYLYE